MTSILWLYFRAFLSSSSEFELRLEKEYRASSLNRAIIKIARASRVRVRAAARYIPSVYPFRVGVVFDDSEICTDADNAALCETDNLPGGIIGFAIGYEQMSC